MIIINIFGRTLIIQRHHWAYDSYKVESLGKLKVYHTTLFNWY